MSDNTLLDTGKKSVRVNEKDQQNVEKAGYDLGVSASTRFSHLAKDARDLQEYRDRAATLASSERTTCSQMMQFLEELSHD